MKTKNSHGLRSNTQKRNKNGVFFEKAYSHSSTMFTIDFIECIDLLNCYRYGYLTIFFCSFFHMNDQQMYRFLFNSYWLLNDKICFPSKNLSGVELLTKKRKKEKKVEHNILSLLTFCIQKLNFRKCSIIR